MASGMPNLVSNLFEGIHKTICKYGNSDKKCETCGTKYEYCAYFLECKNLKDILMEYKCLCCNKNYQKRYDKKLKRQFSNTYKFSNHDINKFTSLLRRDVYPYEYMDSLDRFNETVITWKRRLLQSPKDGRYN